MTHFLTLVLVDRSGPHPVRQAHARMKAYFAPDLAVDRAARCDGFVVGGLFAGEIWGGDQHRNLPPARHQAREGLDEAEAANNIRLVAELRPGLAGVTSCT